MPLSFVGRDSYPEADIRVGLLEFVDITSSRARTPGAVQEDRPGLWTFLIKNVLDFLAHSLFHLYR